MWHPGCEHIKLTNFFNGEMDLEHDTEQAKYVRTAIYIHTHLNHIYYLLRNNKAIVA